MGKLEIRNQKFEGLDGLGRPWLKANGAHLRCGPHLGFKIANRDVKALNVRISGFEFQISSPSVGGFRRIYE
jgi:hypothetical protein